MSEKISPCAERPHEEHHEPFFNLSFPCMPKDSPLESDQGNMQDGPKELFVILLDEVPRPAGVVYSNAVPLKHQVVTT